MSFNNIEEIGTKLAVVITPLAINQKEQIEELLLFRQFSEIEAFRFRFCLMILNLVTAIWWVNLLESNNNRAKRIIDTMVETFTGAFERNQEPIKIGDLIVDPLEVVLINNKMGQIGIGEETMTSYRTLIPIIWNKRMLEYVSAFEEVKAVLEKEGKSGFSPSLFRPIAKYFVRHFTGNPWEKNADFVKDISPFLTSWDMAIHNIVKEVLGEVEPKVKQESSAGSRFKSREEYEAWKARKIKENEEKYQSQKEIDIGEIPSQIKDVAYYFNQGFEYLNSEKYQEAIEVFKKVIRLDSNYLSPDGEDAYTYLAFAYENLEMYKEAIEVHRQEIKIRPDDADYYGLSSAYSKLGMYREAIEVFKQAIKIQPDDADAHYGLAFAYSGLSLHKEAIEAYREAVRIQPIYTNAHLDFASKKLGLHREAIEGYQLRITIRPDDASAYYGLALVYLYSDQKGKALEVYQELKKINPKLAEELFKQIYK